MLVGQLPANAATCEFPVISHFLFQVIDQIVQTVEPLHFDRIYSHFPRLVIKEEAKKAVRRSAERYKAALWGNNVVL